MSFSTTSVGRRVRVAAWPLLLLVLWVAAPAAAEEALVRAPYIVADVESGAVYEHHDAMRPWFPASTTKLMTAYVALKAVENGEITLKSPVVMSSEARSQPPSKIGYPVGTVITVDNALKILMVKSANDISVALAEAVSGSVEKFGERMTAEARRIGMDRSTFVNPHGLPDSRQITTVRDMAILARQLLTEFPEHRGYFDIHAIQVGKQVMRNTNALIDRYPGATGMKTGYICSSGFNLVASAKRDGREVVTVVFGAYDSGDRMKRTARLLDQGFRAAASGRTPEVTLATVGSGKAYAEPIDLRPIICGEQPRPGADTEMFAEPAFEVRADGTLLVRHEDDGFRPTRLTKRQDAGPPIVIPLGGAEKPPAPAPEPTNLAVAAASPPAGGEAQAGEAESAEKPADGKPAETPDLATAFAPTDTSPAHDALSLVAGPAAGDGPPLPRPRPATP